MSVNIFEDGKLNRIAGNSAGGGGVNVTSFESADELKPDQAVDVPVIVSNEPPKSLFAKLSAIAKNTRYLLRILGSTDISKAGNGTVTGAINSLHNFRSIKGYVEENYSTVYARRVGNIIILDGSIWYNYAVANQAYEIKGQLSIESLLEAEEELVKLTTTLQGYNINSVGTTLIAPNIITAVAREDGSSDVVFKTISSAAGTYHHQFSVVYAAVSE